ncbi:MAG: hypothetical protein II135_11220, partial [Clostridia bacterium]|nr:hypothetical protein [Clostridia bacterium]
MKKQIRFVSFLLFFALILPLFGNASAFAMAENATEAAAADEADSMIYASGDELEYAYNALWADWHIPAALECDELSVVKESITPIYYIDTLEYARTGVMTIERAFAGGLDTEPLYIVKLIDKEGNFAGNMTFRVKDGVAKPSGQTIVSEDGFCTASCSYADHAERIRKYLGEDELIPPTDVIFVLAEDICQFFYIKNEKYDLFFAIGCLPTNYTKKYCVGEDDMAVDAAKLKELSDRQLQ